MKLHVLSVEHKHGTNTSIHRTEESARDALHDYVAMWWEREMGDEPMPDGSGQAIEAYFDRVQTEFWESIEASMPEAAVIAEDNLFYVVVTRTKSSVALPPGVEEWFEREHRTILAT